MATVLRWRRAQQYEQGYWERLAARIAGGSATQLDWYRWRADQLRMRLEELGLGELADGSARIVEVGSGPIGVVSFFPASAATTVDPLEEYYRAHPVLSELRTPTVTYLQGVGEALPVPDGSADLLVIENCIDHVRDTDAVMAELRRVLRVGGVLYLTVNSRTRAGYWVHRLLSRARIDAGHPHTFTPARVTRMLNRHGFTLRGMETGSYLEALREDLLSQGLRGKAKALLGVSEYLVSAFAIKAD